MLNLIGFHEPIFQGRIIVIIHLSPCLKEKALLGVELNADNGKTMQAFYLVLPLVLPDRLTLLKVPESLLVITVDKLWIDFKL